MEVFQYAYKYKHFISLLEIGATGFEPATSRPPAERATKLRHTPEHFYFTRNVFCCKVLFSLRNNHF